MVLHKALMAARGLAPAFGVAVAVTLVGTVTGSVMDHVHQIDADTKAVKTVSAVGAHDVQTLTIPEWGVAVSLPLASEMTLLSYAGESDKAVGLSSAALQKLGPDCVASRNALGSILRYPAGEYVTMVKPKLGSSLVATVNDYDYVYQYPQTACANTTSGTMTVNQEAPIVLEALGSLAPIGK